MNAPASGMHVTLMTGSSGTLGRNAGEARNSDLMRKPDSAASEDIVTVICDRGSALFTIEQWDSVFFANVETWILPSFQQ
jgi:hypothetical protein